MQYYQFLITGETRLQDLNTLEHLMALPSHATRSC